MGGYYHREVPAGPLAEGLEGVSQERLALLREAYGSPQWQHSYHYCNCDEGGPLDDRYMSQECLQSWRWGLRLRDEALARLLKVMATTPEE